MIKWDFMMSDFLKQERERQAKMMRDIASFANGTNALSETIKQTQGGIGKLVGDMGNILRPSVMDQTMKMLAETERMRNQEILKMFTTLTDTSWIQDAVGKLSESDFARPVDPIVFPITRRVEQKPEENAATYMQALLARKEELESDGIKRAVIVIMPDGEMLNALGVGNDGPDYIYIDRQDGTKIMIAFEEVSQYQFIFPPVKKREEPEEDDGYVN